VQNMNVWDWVLFAAAAYLAVRSLVGQMIQYRDQLEKVLAEQLRQQVAAKRAAQAQEEASRATASAA